MPALLSRRGAQACEYDLVLVLVLVLGLVFGLARQSIETMRRGAIVMLSFGQSRRVREPVLAR